MPVVNDGSSPLPGLMANPTFIIKSPATTQELEACFDLRWQILRAPWQQPRGNEQDEHEAHAYHVMALLDNNDLIGIGRIHRLTQQQAHIRYMAVIPPFQRCGVGSAILQTLEAKAHEWQVTTILLNARDNAQAFYQSRQYQNTGLAPTLFGSIGHVKMEKSL